MFVSNCPRCGEALRVPAIEESADAEARCPRCQESFPYREISGSLPPVLQVYSVDGQPLSETASAAIPTPIDAPSQAETEQVFPGLNMDGDSEAQPDWDFDSIDAGEDNTHTPLSTPGGPASVNTMPVPMMRKKKGSGIGTAIGVVLGGLAAIPIAGGILMAMGRTPDWGFWPFLGPNRGSGEISAAAPLDTDSVGTSATGNQPSEPNQSRSFGQSFASDGSLIDEQTANEVTPQQKVLEELGEPEADPQFRPMDDPFALPEDNQEQTTRIDSNATEDNSDEAVPTPKDSDSSLTTEPAEENSTSTESAIDTKSDLLDDTDPIPDPADIELPPAFAAEEPVDLPVIADVNESTTATEIAQAAAAAEAVVQEPMESDDDRLTQAAPEATDLAETADDAEPPRNDPTSAESVPTDLAETVAPERSSPSVSEVAEVTEETKERQASNETTPAAPVSNKRPLAEKAADSEVQLAIEMTQKLTAFDGSTQDRRRLLARTYLKIAEAAEQTAASPQAAERLADALVTSNVVSELEYAAAQWLKHGKRTTDGIALVGRPSEEGERVTLTLKDGQSIDLGSLDVPDAEKILVIGIIQSQETVEGILAAPVQ